MPVHNHKTVKHASTRLRVDHHVLATPLQRLADAVGVVAQGQTLHAHHHPAGPRRHRPPGQHRVCVAPPGRFSLSTHRILNPALSLRASPGSTASRCSRSPSGPCPSSLQLSYFSSYGAFPNFLLALRARLMAGLHSSYPPLWPLLSVYYVWANWIDKSPEHGGRTSPWFRSLKFWTYFADYYPASCVLLSRWKGVEWSDRYCADSSRRVGLRVSSVLDLCSCIDTAGGRPPGG